MNPSSLAESEDSDNEPLSLLAEEKNSKLLAIESADDNLLELRTRPLFTKIYEKKKCWRKSETLPNNNCDERTTSFIQSERTQGGEVFTNMFISYILPPLKLDEQLSDVWLDVKSINQTGPMSCILCFECFINKNKLIMHYVLNHNKPFCGTCRYLMADKQTWDVHWQCHLPLRCSHCTDEFLDEPSLRTHYISYHHLAHCRMCNLMLPAGDLYNNHLYKKHSVTLEQYEEKDEVWTIVYPESWIFACLLCSKDSLQNFDFLRHFLYHHKFSLKCLATIVNGKNLGFSVLGANVNTFTQSSEPEKKSSYDVENTNNYTNSEKHLSNNDDDSYQFLEALIPEIKQEVLSDDDHSKDNDEELLSDTKTKRELETLDPGNDLSLTTESFLIKWSGREDFDVTYVQFVPIRRSETDYIDNSLMDMNSSIVTSNNFLNYENDKRCDPGKITCPLCYPLKYLPSFFELIEHVVKHHTLKSIPNYTCRLCLIHCQTHTEMQKHVHLENGSFRNLYLCQFCEEEFPSRESARDHLSIHWQELITVECTSPQVGLKCRYCNLLFWHELERERHHCESHYSSYREHFYRCSSCQMIFSDKIWWASHEKNEHCRRTRDQDDKREAWFAFKCVICCRVYSELSSLREHFLDLHPTTRRLYCAVAGCVSRPFRLPRYLKQHCEVVHNSQRSIETPGLVGLRCVECGKQMRTARAAATHRTVAHGDKSGSRFKCRICGHGLPSIQDRKLHYLVVHPGVPPFSCSVCGKGYNNKSALYTHRTQSHSVNVITYTCSFCSKIFNKRDSYKEHLLIHVGPRHACPHCSRVFVQRSNMLRHIRLHTGEKPYACVHCDKTFSDKGACNAHIRTHTRQDVNACVYCGQEFLQKQKLKYHMRKHTGEDLETCVICTKKFTNLTNLREHMKTHDDSSPTACPQCGKMFTSKRYMERHLKDNHSDTAEVHSCPLCGRSCPRLTALRNHLLTHSPVKHIQCLVCGKRYNGKKSVNRHLQKRHGIQITDDSYSSSFHQLDPRQCSLGLDEETLSRIFGPEKNVKPCLPFQITNIGVLKLKIKTSQAYTPPNNDDSDGEYRPNQKIKTENMDHSADDADVPISGLDLASLRTRVKRETAKNVKYEFDSDDDKPFSKMLKKKGKIKFRRKFKTKSVHTNSQDDGTEDEECDKELPIFPLVEIKCEPVDYD